MIVTALRMIADLERMGDLAGARRQGRPAALPRARRCPTSCVPTIVRDGQVAEQMVGKAGASSPSRDVEAARELEARRRRDGPAAPRAVPALLDDDWPYGVEAAIDITLLGRYYERFADHAVSVARRVVYLVTGDTVTAADHRDAGASDPDRRAAVSGPGS